jgi:hypothetical protein
MGYTYCFRDTSEFIPVQIECDKLPPEEVARQRADTDARYAVLNRLYDEQEALSVPATKADLTLLCDYSTVQIWFRAGLLTWGMGANRAVWRLDRVSPTEITFSHVWPSYSGDGLFSQSNGYIDRVTGSYGRNFESEKGDCKPAEPKF